MDPETFIRGLAIGFVIAAAIGPIGLLCIRRTLEFGARPGVATGLGAATADAFYAAIAAFGLTALSGFLVAWRRPLGIVGGVFLVVLAVRALRSAPAPRAEPHDAESGMPHLRPRLATAYVTTLALTLTNPATVLSFAAAFVGLGLASSAPVALTAGVFAGSSVWWLILVGAVLAVRRRIPARTLRRVSAVSAVLMGILGTAALVGSVAGAF